MTTPSQIRSVLLRLARRARADIKAVAASSQDPATIRSALFAATPLIVSEYSDGSSALALEWYDEFRDAAEPDIAFTPRPLTLVTDDDVAAIVAQTTATMREIQEGVEREVEEAVAESVRLLEEQTEQLVADAFRDTMTGNVAADPAAVGWRRFARPEACKLCTMLAARGAVYTEATARFAAHSAVMAGNRKGGNCMCIAAPAFGGPTQWEEATPLQYVASRRKRTEAERKALRAYLNKNYPDAPG